MVDLSSIAWILVYALVPVLLFIAALVVLNSMRTKGSIARALSMTLFRVTVPRDSDLTGPGQKPEKELIAVMEQLYGSFTNEEFVGECLSTNLTSTNKQYSIQSNLLSARLLCRLGNHQWKALKTI